MSLLSTFLRWWGTALLDLVPASVRSVVAPEKPVIVGTGHPDVRLVRLARSMKTEISTLDAIGERYRKRLQRDARRGAIELAAGIQRQDTVEIMTTLPRMAESNLSEALDYEIDRLTPFEPAEIYYAGEIAGPSSQDSIAIRLTYTARARADRIIDRMTAAGLPPTRLGVLDKSERLGTANLLPGRSRKRWRAGRVVAAVLAVLSVLSLAGWWTLSYMQRTDRIAVLERQLADTRRAALERQAVTGGPEGYEQLKIKAFEAKQSALSALLLLDALTEALPDNTVLTTLEVQQNTIVMSGNSTEASGLIARLDGHPGFSNPVFRSPITRSETEGRSSFVLSVDIVRTGLNQ